MEGQSNGINSLDSTDYTGLLVQPLRCGARLRIDKGYLRGALHLARRFKTMIDVII